MTLDRRPISFFSSIALTSIALIYFLSLLNLPLIIKKLIFCCFTLVFLPTILANIYEIKNKDRYYIKISDSLKKYTILSMIAPTLIIISLFAVDTNSNFINKLSSEQFISISFALILTICVTASAFILKFLPNPEFKFLSNNAKSIISWGLILFTITMFFDINLYYDVHHYMPFVGPAHLVLNGGIPLYDVFSQYGQGYLFIDLFFAFLPETFTTAALAIYTINALQFILFLLMLYKLVKSRLTFIMFGSLAIGVWYFIPDFPHNNTPSHGGMRYFATYFLMATILYLPKNKKYSFLTILALALSVFWSFEACINSVVIYLGFLLIPYLIQKPFSFSELVTEVLKFGFIFTSLILTQISIYKIVFGHYPRIDLYLSLISPYLSNNMQGNSSEFYDLSYCTLADNFYYWIIVSTLYASVLAYSYSTRFIRIQDQKEYDFIYLISVLAIFGIITSATCILNTNKVNLIVSSFPFYLLLAYIVDKLSTNPKRHIILRTCLLLPLTILFFTSINIISRTDKPYQRLADSLISGNQIKFRKLSIFCDPINNACRPEKASGGVCVNSPNELTCMPSEDYIEASKLIAKWQSNKTELQLIDPWASIISVKEHKRLFIPTAWPVVDILSTRLTEIIISGGLKSLKSGDNLIISKDYLGNNYRIVDFIIGFDHNALNMLILNKIVSKWQLNIMDESDHFVVYNITDLQMNHDKIS